jgi:hypothetical protein
MGLDGTGRNQRSLGVAPRLLTRYFSWHPQRDNPCRHLERAEDAGYTVPEPVLRAFSSTTHTGLSPGLLTDC